MHSSNTARTTAAQVMCIQPQHSQFPHQSSSSNKRRAIFDSSPVLLKRQRVHHTPMSMAMDDTTCNNNSLSNFQTSPPPTSTLNGISPGTGTDVGRHSNYTTGEVVLLPSSSPRDVNVNSSSSARGERGGGMNMNFGFGLGFGMVQSEEQQKQVSTTSVPPSPSHTTNKSTEAIIGAPSSKPWWLQTPRKRAACHKNGKLQRNASCYYCDAPQDTVACERCEKSLCDMCTRYCDVCSAAWCPCCTVVDYNSPHERTLCFECNDEDGCREDDTSNSSMDSDGDDVMLSWQ